MVDFYRENHAKIMKKSLFRRFCRQIVEINFSTGLRLNNAPEDFILCKYIYTIFILSICKYLWQKG